MTERLRDMLQILAINSSAGPGSYPLSDGFQAISLGQDEVERVSDACIQHSDFKVCIIPFDMKAIIQIIVAVQQQ